MFSIKLKTKIIEECTISSFFFKCTFYLKKQLFSFDLLSLFVITIFTSHYIRNRLKNYDNVRLGEQMLLEYYKVTVFGENLKIKY